MFSASPSFSDTSYHYMFRYSVKNVLLIGLWYGVKKPKINSLLEAFLCKIEMLETEGKHSKSSFWLNFILLLEHKLLINPESFYRLHSYVKKKYRIEVRKKGNNNSKLKVNLETPFGLANNIFCTYS